MTKYEEFCRDMAAAREKIGTPFDVGAPQEWMGQRDDALIGWAHFAVALVSDDARGLMQDIRCANALLRVACCGEAANPLPRIARFRDETAVAEWYEIAKWTNRHLIDQLEALISECAGLAEWSCDANYLVVMKSVVLILDRVVAGIPTRRRKRAA